MVDFFAGRVLGPKGRDDTQFGLAPPSRDFDPGKSCARIFLCDQIHPAPIAGDKPVKGNGDGLFFEGEDDMISVSLVGNRLLRSQGCGVRRATEGHDCKNNKKREA
jgi:hypothetical protein